jgi:hypothetical protein
MQNISIPHKPRSLRTAFATTLIAALPFVALIGITNAHAKGPLVYCSEGSPEGFQPQPSTGTTF